MTDSLFRPFETHLDRKSAREILKSTLIGAEDGELFLERCRSEVLSFDDGRLRRSSFEASEGFGLRAVQGERVGYAHSTEISEQAMRRSAGHRCAWPFKRAAAPYAPRRPPPIAVCTATTTRFWIRASPPRSTFCAKLMLMPAA
jgi:predicted Zn-dependent protease